MDAALYTLLGVVVGAAASFGGTYLQQRLQDRRDRLQMAVTVALKDYEQDMVSARNRPGGALVAPPEVYVHHHMRMLEAIAKGALTPDLIKELKAEREVLYAALR